MLAAIVGNSFDSGHVLAVKHKRVCRASRGFKLTTVFIQHICLAGIAPYMALELAVFDLVPQDMPSFARGVTSAFVATTLCYPLDTVRHATSCHMLYAVYQRHVIPA